MKKRIAGIIGALALMITASASVGCVVFLFDEPNTPKSLMN